MNFSQDEILEIRIRVRSIIGGEYPARLTVQEGAGLHIRLNAGEASITAEDKTALARGCFLLLQASLDGKTELDIHETRHIASCGPFIDCSRGGVMTVDACKRYVDRSSALGMNLFMLYLEDTYTIPGRPYFGHLRGRYTADELKELDRYCTSLGVEFLPSIQTLAHLEQYLQWEENSAIRDTDSCVMIDEDAVYELIEDEIRTMRECVTTDRLHIGMDEAHGVGLGHYFEKHGAVNRFELLCRHLNRVVAICEKYHFKPMMWSDMFFRLGSKTNDYYDFDAHVPQEVIDNLPKVDMVYWDYYHGDEAEYEHMITEHERMGTRTVLAGGIWTWSGFLPNVQLTEKTMRPALKVAAKHGISTALATMWGDDGNETNQFLAMNLLPIFSENCWRGSDCTDADIDHMGETLSGVPANVYKAYGAFYPKMDKPEDERTGKALIWSDLLYPLIVREPDEDYLDGCAAAHKLLSTQEDEDCRYAATLFEICLLKASIMKDIREAYAVQDRNAIGEIAQESIPCLISMYNDLENEHRVQWHRTFKHQGWELMSLRYGAVKGRMEDVALQLIGYADGMLSVIEELEEEALPAARKGGSQTFRALTDPKY